MANIVCRGMEHKILRIETSDKIFQRACVMQSNWHEILDPGDYFSKNFKAIAKERAILQLYDSYASLSGKY